MIYLTQLTATASYLVAHHMGALAAAIAATRGYTLAITAAAALLGRGMIVTILLLPSRHRRSAGKASMGFGTGTAGDRPARQYRRRHLHHPYRLTTL